MTSAVFVSETACEDKNLNVGVSVGLRASGRSLRSPMLHFFGDMPGASSSVLTLMGTLRRTVRRRSRAGQAGAIKTHVEFGNQRAGKQQQYFGHAAGLIFSRCR
jgi:hypothetical protein